MPALKSVSRAEAGDPRAGALAKLMFSMRRALVERRQVIEIGDAKFRFQRRNEQFETDDVGYQALSSGVFAYYTRTNGSRQLPGIWMRLGSSDDLEDLLAPHLQDMAAEQLEELRTVISGNAALQSLANDREAARRPRP